LEVDVKTLLAALPRGGTLPTEAWQTRHRAILLLLWAHAAGILLIGIRVGHGQFRTVVECGLLAVLAALAALVGRRNLKALLATVGLLTSSALLVHMSGDAVEMHFHFLVIVMIIAMYQDWTPFFAAAVFVAVHYGVMGVLDPTAVFNHQDAWRSSWKWAGVHGGFVIAAAVVAIIHWRMQERAQEEVQRVQRLMGERLYEGQSALVNELQEAHRLKSELFNIVSHEFRTPLAGIIGFTALLSRKEGGDLTEEQRESHLQTIARQAERLNRLVENLFFSGHEIEPSEDAVASIEDAVRAVRLQIAESHDDIGLEIMIAPGLRPRIAQGALALVVLNLVSNAIKHAEPNTDVVVAARHEGGEVAVSVTNIGEPIPVEHRARIFEPFVQSDGAARTSEGLGLGLHIVRKLVRAYGGTVAVDSGDHDVTFTIRLPHSPSTAAPPPVVLSDPDRVA
jgi:signal transduction histidine kinase